MTLVNNMSGREFNLHPKLPNEVATASTSIFGSGLGVIGDTGDGESDSDGESSGTSVYMEDGDGEGLK